MPAKRAPNAEANFTLVFRALRKILAAHKASLVVAVDEDDHYVLNSCRPHPTNGQAMMVGAVRIGKNYVSYHLMPVYCCPDVITGCSAALKKRMQGKSCFNFTVPDEALFKELAGLTKRGLAAFAKAGFA